MFDLKICTVCLKGDVKIISMNIGQLRSEYNLASGLKTYINNGLPEYLCYQCFGYVKSFKKFRDKCQRSYYTLQEILHKNQEITKSIIEELDLDMLDIKPSLSYLAPGNVKVSYESVKFKWENKNRVGIKQQEVIPIMKYTTISDDFELPAKKPRLLADLIDECIKEEDTTVNNSKVPETEIKYDTNYDTIFESHDSFELGNDNQFDCKEVQDKENETDVDGMNLDEQYATMVPISMSEAKAAVEVYKLFAHGKYQCQVCKRAYFNQNRLDIHMRMHDTHTSGTHHCDLCNYYYRTEFLLKTHMTDKHMYKYLCKECPEISFDKKTAKKHFICTHLQKGSKKDDLCEIIQSEDKDSKKNKLFVRPFVKKKLIPNDYPLYTPLSQEEQYALVRDRQKTKNYTDSPYTCEFCFKGFREVTTYDKHMVKHDPNISGKFQCDACKIYFPDTRKMYKHMNISHLFKYSCQMCTYVCFSRGQAKMHYRWHKNVTYSCPHCQKEFSKMSTKLTHIRIKHPSMNICTLCGHSFVSVTGLYCHKKLAHSKEEVDETAEELDPAHPLYCAECGIQFRNEAAFATHFGSSYKHADTNLSIKPVGRSGKPAGRARTRRSNVVNTGVPTSSTCEFCNKYLPNDSQARQHYDAEHPGAPYLKRYMCDICGHTTRQFANLTVHMRTHTQEKPYACPYCERRFSMPSNRDRHLVVHTGEKRYQCQHCNRRFTQSSAVKLHIQTVHLKIPYAPWDKKNRKRRREAEAAPAARPPPPLPRGNYLSAYITYSE